MENAETDLPYTFSEGDEENKESESDTDYSPMPRSVEDLQTGEYSMDDKVPSGQGGTGDAETGSDTDYDTMPSTRPPGVGAHNIPEANPDEEKD